jgi:hypothetical protein
MLGERPRQPLRPSVGEVDAKLAHDLDDLRMDAPARVRFASG